MTPVSADAHVFVADVAAPELYADDHRHLTRSLRLRSGAAVTAADGRGCWRPCRLTRNGELEPVGDVTVDRAPEPPVTVAFALVKGQRPDLIVQKLTELGVDRIVPFVSERSVVRWDAAKAERQRKRFATIVRQAALQCRRSWLPTIGLGDQEPSAGEGLPSFTDVAPLPGAALADREGVLPPRAPSTVLIGPEGGWSPGELEAGLPRVRVGEHVLRAETAAITAGALLVALRSDIVAPAVSSQAAALPPF